MATKLNPRNYERDFDARTGDMGQGHRLLKAEQFDLSGYEPWSSPGARPAAFAYPLYQDGIPSGWEWRGWVRSPNKVIAFETLLPIEARLKMLDQRFPVHNGAPWECGVLRELLQARGISIDDWLAAN